MSTDTWLQLAGNSSKRTHSNSAPNASTNPATPPLPPMPHSLLGILLALPPNIYMTILTTADTKTSKKANSAKSSSKTGSVLTKKNASSLMDPTNSERIVKSTQSTKPRNAECTRLREVACTVTDATSFTRKSSNSRRWSCRRGSIWDFWKSRPE